MIRGPGGPTGDRIPAMLSDGEFVVRAAAVRQPGMLQMLQDINAGLSSMRMGVTPITRMIPAFADGGSVEPLRSSLDSSLTVGLDEGLILKSLQSPEGQRVLVKLIGKNKRGVRGVLGT